jgi:dinuclear metal center YbgI/SA1388 family protein
MTMDEFVRIVEDIAPREMACEWDNTGLLLRCGETVERVLVALDATAEVADEAVAGGFDMLLVHHPAIFSPKKALDHRSPADVVIMKLIRAGISLYAAHTSFDKAAGGINDMLAQRLGLDNVRIVSGPEDGLMRVGKLAAPMETAAFLDLVKRAVGADGLRVTEGSDAKIETVAVLGGSGGDFAAAAHAAGADALVTGEAKHHHFLEAAEFGLLLVEAGHFATERGFVDEIFMSLQARLNKVQLHVHCEKAQCINAPYRFV